MKILYCHLIFAISLSLIFSACLSPEATKTEKRGLAVKSEVKIKYPPDFRFRMNRPVVVRMVSASKVTAALGKTRIEVRVAGMDKPLYRGDSVRALAGKLQLVTPTGTRSLQVTINPGTSAEKVEQIPVTVSGEAVVRVP